MRPSTEPMAKGGEKVKTVVKLAVGILVTVAVVASIAFLVMNGSNKPNWRSNRHLRIDA